MTQRSVRGRGWGLAAVGLALLLLMLAAAAPGAAQGEAQGSGTLTGTVSNGTAGGAPIGAGITVTLHVYQDQAEVETRQATTDPGGGYSFDGLSTDAARSYTVEAFYLGIGYPGESAITFAGGQTAMQADLTVYETTGDAGQISIDSGHLIAESLGPMLRVSELYLFGNTGDRTYVGSLGSDGQLSTVRIPLPADAVGLAFGEQDAADRYILGEAAEGWLRDTTPVRPGQETMLVFFSYHLPAAETIHVERRYDYDIALLSVLLAQPGLSLASDDLQARGPQSFQNRQYDQYAAVDLPTGSPLVLDLTVTATEPAAGTQPNPAAGQPVRDNQALVGTIGFILAGLAGAGALGYGLAARPRAAGQTSVALEGNPRARQLIAEVADLDDAFEAGHHPGSGTPQVDEEAYRRERAGKVEAIRTL